MSVISAVFVSVTKGSKLQYASLVYIKENCKVESSQSAKSNTHALQNLLGISVTRKNIKDGSLSEISLPVLTIEPNPSEKKSDPKVRLDDCTSENFTKITSNLKKTNVSNILDKTVGDRLLKLTTRPQKTSDSNASNPEKAPVYKLFKNPVVRSQPTKRASYLDKITSENLLQLTSPKKKFIPQLSQAKTSRVSLKRINPVKTDVKTYLASLTADDTFILDSPPKKTTHFMTDVEVTSNVQAKLDQIQEILRTSPSRPSDLENKLDRSNICSILKPSNTPGNVKLICKSKLFSSLESNDNESKKAAKSHIICRNVKKL